MLNVETDHGGIGHEVSMGHFVEQAEGLLDLALSAEGRQLLIVGVE